MDHYKVLGISKNASKDEIKQAYRKLAMQFHPDKHAHSPSNLREAATLKFKLLSEAYETLIDDRMRADYNIRRSSNQNHYNRSSHHNYGRTSYNTDYNRNGNYNSGRSNSSNFNGYGSGYGYGYSGAAEKGGGRAGGVGLRMEMFFSFLNTKAFLLNAAFVGFLLAGSVVISSGGHTLWKMQNSGKSFEDAMESIEKAKKFKDKT